MALADAFRSTLLDGDADGLMRGWASVFPDLPRPADLAEAEVVLHQARTAAESVALPKRLYSHAWLSERGMRSQLPDPLRPPGERVNPVIASAVGVSVKPMSARADRRAEAREIERIMADAGGELIALGITDRERVSRRMWQARDDYLKRRLRRVL